MKFEPSRWTQVPMVASFLVVCGLVAGGAIYLLNYQERDEYITSRNFRLLAVLAQQTKSAIDSHLHTKASGNGVSAAQTSSALSLSQGRSTIDLYYWASAMFDRTSVSTILRPVFAPKIDQGAFDTLALATPDGRVAFAVGRREWELSSMNLAVLLADGQAATAAAAAAAGADDARTFARITVLDAVVAGVPYKMFVQPCCQLLAYEGRTVSGVAAQPAGAVVVGMVAADAIRDEAMAISPTLVVVASLLVALAFLAWPFLNVALPGPRKRVTKLDALQLGSYGTVGLAIATILAITSVQCARLESDLERQLSELASEIDQELADEITTSAARLDAFEAWLAACPNEPVPEGKLLGYVVEKGCTSSGNGASMAAVAANGKDYSTAALIDRDGRQIRKAWPNRKRPPLVDVNDRDYFKVAYGYAQAPLVANALSDGPVTCLGPPCVLQSLVSYTSGEPSAVLARPTRAGIALPVASITLPMRSVIAPVLPPGFEFAVIEKSGRVVFHSDAQRNTFEDLFLETDRNRQLRSLVVAGVDGSVRTEYWGRPYLAHVKHAQAYGWSVVTLFDRRTLRGLMLEWTMVSLLCLGVYSVLWVVAVIFAVATGAAWLWPDRFRKRRYDVLSALYLLLIVAFGVAFVSPSFPRSWMAILGFAVPAVACALSVVVLKRRPAARVGVSRLDYQHDYCVAGALLMVITGILPGAAFVTRSYDAHVEAYLKHRQLSVVQALAVRPSFDSGSGYVSAAPPDAAGSAAQHLKGWHAGFLYGTALCRETDDAASPSAEKRRRAPGGMVAAAQLEPCPVAAAPAANTDADPQVTAAGWTDWIAAAAPYGPGRLEHYLPYFSEMSVQIREFVRRAADDGSWISAREGDRAVLRVPQPRIARPGTIKASTALPPLAIAQWAAGLPLLLVLAALAYGIAYFIARYVFLGAVTSPMWALGRLAIAEGRPVLVVCNPVAMAPQIHGAATLRLGDVVTAADPMVALRDKLDQIDHGPSAGQPILVTDLDSGDPGAEALAAKVRLLAGLAGERTRAVMVLARQPLPELAEAIKSAQLADSAAIAELQAAIAELKKRGVMVLDWRAHPGAATGPLTLTATTAGAGWWRHLVRRLRNGTTAADGPARNDPEGEALLRAEERGHPALRPICDGIRRLDAFCGNRLSRAELLEEIDERAEGLYAQLWNSCSDSEKLELRHVAQFGLANPGNSRAVRQLIMKRLLRKDPDLRLMNRTFQRFVVSPHATGHVTQRDVARIEGELEASAWDQIRAPFVIGMIGVAAFLFITQRETYNATIGAVVGLATQVPNILKAVTMVVQKDSGWMGGQRNA